MIDFSSVLQLKSSMIVLKSGACINVNAFNELMNIPTGTTTLYAALKAKDNGSMGYAQDIEDWKLKGYVL